MRAPLRTRTRASVRLDIFWMRMRGRGDKCINMRVLKADVSWGWGICSVICSFRRHLSLGVRALLQEVCNNPPPTPPQPSGRGGRSRRGHRGRVPGRRRPAAQRFLARVGGDVARQACLVPGGAGTGASLRGRSWRNLSPAPGERPSRRSPFPPPPASASAGGSARRRSQPSFWR